MGRRPGQTASSIYLEVPVTISKTPSVKYRGVFINDEDWGLLPWARHTFDPERGNIGPKTYAKVCELLLRLKANYLCPAMHEASTAFNKIPENKMVADSFRHRHGVGPLRAAALQQCERVGSQDDG